MRRLAAASSPVTRLAAATSLLVGASIVPAVVAAGLDGPEVVAAVLLCGVALVAVLSEVRGGLVGASVATALYAVLRAGAGQLEGGAGTPALVVAHGVGFVVVAVAVGLAARRWRAGEAAAENAYVDAATGLFNARYFALEADAQLARAKRYDRVCAVVAIEVPAAPIEALGRKGRARVLAALGEHLSTSVRSTDRVVVTADGRSYRLAVILPETDADGAKVFAERLADRVGAFLFSHNAGVPHPSPVVAVLPGDEAKFLALRAELLGIARRR